MYAACLRGRGPLALMEYVDLAPIIPTRSRRDDSEEYPDPGFLTVCLHVFSAPSELGRLAALEARGRQPQAAADTS